MSIEIKGGNELRQFLNNPSCQDARKAANNWKEGLHNLSLHIGNQLALCKIIRQNTTLKDIVKEENNDERDVYFIIFSVLQNLLKLKRMILEHFLMLNIHYLIQY